MSETVARILTEDDVLAMTINDLVVKEPELLRLLAPLGIDLCCGGSLPLGEALARHGIMPEPVAQEVVAVLVAATR